MIFNFFANLMTYFSKKKMTKYSQISYLFLTSVQNFKPKRKRLFMACVFECFQTHCHILKELHKSMHTMGAITIFGESIFIFSLVVINW